MAEATLEPPPNEALVTVQEAFDRALPASKPTKAEQKPVPEPERPAEKPKPEAKPAPETKPETEKPATELKLPSFFTEKKPDEPAKPAEPEIKLDDLPKEPPEGADEKIKVNWRKTRQLLEQQDAELSELRSKQAQREEKGKQLSSADAERLKELEQKTAHYEDQLKRMGLVQDPAFQQQIIRPLQATYGEAKRIIKDAGGNPESLDKALMLTGKDHYAAMDEILAELPQSAQGELTGVMRDYRRFAQARAEAMANAPQTFDQLQKQRAIEEKQFWEDKKGELSKQFEDRVKYLRDVAKLETLIPTNDKEAGWWNEIPPKVESLARKIALENQDPEVVMDASILAASALTYRDLFLKANDRADKAEQLLSEIKGAEPRITDAGEDKKAPKKDDLSRPFADVFIETLKKQARK